MSEPIQGLHLVLGDKNYSSWSMRPWVALRAAGIPFGESTIELDTPSARNEKLRHSPAGRVPILLDSGFAVWDSLAICEYVAELHPDAGLWPSDLRARARARSLCAEMHAGFLALRTELPMNIRRDKARHDAATDACRDDLRRIGEIFAAAEGEFLFGSFSIADAFFAPVACRLRSYRIALDGPAAAYAARLLAHPAVEAWCAAAREETHRLPKYDALA
jgi:glutathione S-transferase